MKEIILPVTSHMLCSSACEHFGIQIRAPQSDADSDSSNEAEFVVAVSINRQEDTGLSLRVGDKLVLVNGRPVAEMWNSKVEKGVLKLSFDEKRKKRRTRIENIIPRVTCAISRLGKEGQDNIYLWPDTERTQKLLKSSGAVVTINSIMAKMEALDASRDKVSQHSR